MKDRLTHVQWCGVLYDVISTTGFSAEEALVFVEGKYEDVDPLFGLGSFTEDCSAGFYD